MAQRVVHESVLGETNFCSRLHRKLRLRRRGHVHHSPSVEKHDNRLLLCGFIKYVVSTKSGHVALPLLAPVLLS